MHASRYWGLRRDEVAPETFSNQIRDVEIRVADLVGLAIPANAQAAAEALGLKVHREEAEIALECLRDWGISARILENTPGSPLR